jgi:hypothetical protein
MSKDYYPDEIIVKFIYRFLENEDLNKIKIDDIYKAFKHDLNLKIIIKKVL